jgi:hypothetical protein
MACDFPTFLDRARIDVDPLFDEVEYQSAEPAVPTTDF